LHPAFGRLSQSPTPAEVFVLIPLAGELKPVYEDHIKAVAASLSRTVARADDLFAANSVMQQDFTHL